MKGSSAHSFEVCKTTACPDLSFQHWIVDDDGIAIYRLDITLPDLRYTVEYDGDESHGGDDMQADLGRRIWLEEERSWTIGV